MNTTARKTRDVTSMLIGWESTFHTMTQHAGRAVTNLHQELGGFSATTPGNGSPGGGKGGGRTVEVRVERGEPWRRSQVDPLRLDDDERAEWERRQRAAALEVDRVPVSSVEMQALGLAGVDEAAVALDRFSRWAIDVVGELRVLCRVGYVDPGPELPATMGPHRQIVLGYARVRRLRRADDITPLPVEMFDAMRDLDTTIDRLYHLVRRWGYTPTRPAPPRRSDLLAVDLTERLCTSHLRAGERLNRVRGELCDWCYRHGPLLVATWTAPPIELVRLKIEKGKVYAHDVEPFLRAEREAQAKRAKWKGVRGSTGAVLVPGVTRV